MHRNEEPLNYEQGLHYALRLLQQRQYSQAKLQQKLRMKGVNTDDAERIIQKLLKLRLLDDARYAESLVRHEANFRQTSTWTIKQKLRQKGIAVTTIESALDDPNADLVAERERAQHHADRYLIKLHKKELPLTEKKQKLAAYLYRKGFGRDAIGTIMSNLRDEQNPL
jgi:regulatory protein